jgi:hypothetical protein
LGSATPIRTVAMMAEVAPCSRGAARRRIGVVPTDLEDITARVMRYGERLDAGYLDGVAALFAHATWRSPARGEPLRSAEQVRRAYDGVLPLRRHPATPRRHQPAVEVELPDRARALLLHRLPGGRTSRSRPSSAAATTTPSSARAPPGASPTG